MFHQCTNAMYRKILCFSRGFNSPIRCSEFPSVSPPYKVCIPGTSQIASITKSAQFLEAFAANRLRLRRDSCSWLPLSCSTFSPAVPFLLQYLFPCSTFSNEVPFPLQFFYSFKIYIEFLSFQKFGISGGGVGCMLVVTQNQFSVAWVILGLA